MPGAKRPERSETPRAVRQKWCVSLSGNGWGFYLHRYKDESDDNADTDVYNSFTEAKKECLWRYRSFLNDVKEAMSEVRRMKATASEDSK